MKTSKQTKKKLSAQVDIDLGNVENSASHLESGLDSIAEVIF